MTEEQPGAVDRATSFGAVADAYDALRPSWPATTAGWLVGDPDPGRRLQVLDLGAGTGKLTRALAGLGHDVVAVDPDAAMLARLRRALSAAGHDVQTRVGSAEAIPAQTSEFDAVTVAQAWHWFDADLAMAQCARVLRPGGVLGVAWHRRDESVTWVRRLAETVGRMGDVATRPPDAAPQPSLEFGPVDEAVFDYVLTTTPQGLRRLADTWSYVRLAPDREQKLAAVEELGRANAVQGRVVVPHRTFCYRTYSREVAHGRRG